MVICIDKLNEYIHVCHRLFSCMKLDLQKFYIMIVLCNIGANFIGNFWSTKADA